MEEELKQLKCESIKIDMRLLVKVEAVLGMERINQLKTERQCEVTVSEKVLLLKAIGYTEDEAMDLDPAVCDAEMTALFTRWLERSLVGKFNFLHSQPSPTVSTAPKPSRSASKPKAKPAKTSSRKGSRSRR